MLFSKEQTSSKKKKHMNYKLLHIYHPNVPLKVTNYGWILDTWCRFKSHSRQSPWLTFSLI